MELQHLAEHLRRESILAVDTESNSLHAYREQVCLIQFSTQEQDYLVDPLSLEDLSPLAPVFSDPGIEKIFHAAEYDLICMGRDFGFKFENLFDTMIAARILGWEAVGLGSILKTEFGISLNKRYQRANWGQRPLPPHLLKYARLDTHYLISLRNRQRTELAQSDLLALAAEDFNRMSAMNNNPDGHLAQGEDKPIDPWRVSGSYDLEPQQAAVLQELCRYRDKVARSLNRPLFKVIHDQTLLAIAAQTPKNRNELCQLPGMSQRQVRRHGSQLLRAIQRGLRAKPIYPPRSPRPDRGFLERQEALRGWRKRTARDMGVPSDVVLPRDLMNTLAQRAPSSAEELAGVLSDVPWRLERFGDQILEVVSVRNTE